MLATTARFAPDRLKAPAKGAVARDVSDVLVVRVHNAGKSQMAAALLARHDHGAVTVRSAGSPPAPELKATVVAALAEAGIDLLEKFPSPLTDDVVRAADIIFTMGCGDACPNYPGKRYLD